MPSQTRSPLRVWLGTDTLPLHMSEQMRETGTGDVLHAATVSGAQSPGHEDIGRLCAGAKADLVLVNVAHPAMQPLHDPLRSLVYVVAGRAVRDVFVALDQADAGRRLQRALAEPH